MGKFLLRWKLHRAQGRNVFLLLKNGDYIIGMLKMLSRTPLGVYYIIVCPDGLATCGTKSINVSTIRTAIKLENYGFDQARIIRRILRKVTRSAD